MGADHGRFYRPGGDPGIVLDDALDPQLMNQVLEDWPHIDQWFRYDSPIEQKWTKNRELPDSVMTAIGQLATLVQVAEGNTPDLSLHGAGLSMMGREDFLGCHLDAELHPVFKMRREENAILFVDDWDTSWGGQLEVWQDDKVVFSAYPKHNRLVLFDATKVHSVHNPIQCPPDRTRKAINLYWWSYWPWTKNSDRPRALFFPSPGSEPSPELDALRRSRSQLSATKGQ
jgi:hypothetical protein